MDSVVKRSLGAISMLFGVAILGWFAHNLIWPMYEFNRSFRSALQLTVPAAMVYYGWRWLTDGGPGIETLQIDQSAPELAEAVREARRTMARFLEAVRRHEDGTYIKFPLVTDSGVTEHIWAYVHHYSDRVFNVSLANTPYTQRGAIDTRRDVRETDVEDWQIVTREGRIRGGYSLRALFTHVERNGIRLTKTMKRQRAQFLDAAER